MKDEETANGLVNKLIETMMHDNDEDEVKASHEWKSLELSTKVKVFGIIGYWSGSSKIKKMFELAESIVAVYINNKEEEEE